MEEKEYKVLGLMSGSSLDGLDIAYCTFKVNKNESNPIVDWSFQNGETTPFSEMWIARLANLTNQTAYDFVKTNTYFGHYCAGMVNDFIEKNNLDIDFISSHGHTIFHYPDKRVTVQIGDGAAMAALTGLPVINDFRTHDIAINGEGAPIAPIADNLLFSGSDFYLNIGGISNVSTIIDGKAIAFDIGPANQILNALANKLDLEYDKDGMIASGGKMLEPLFEELNNHDFYKKKYPKSLDNNQVFHNFTSAVINFDGSWQDKLHTSTKHIAFQIAVVLNRLSKNQKKTLFVTGGGGFNQYLMSCIDEYAPNIEVVIPKADTIMFKEAILMGLMGVLRVEGIVNCLASVTGADIDTIGGAIYQGTKKRI